MNSLVINKKKNQNAFCSHTDSEYQLVSSKLVYIIALYVAY